VFMIIKRNNFDICKDKWEHYAENYQLDNSKLATYELTVRNVLELLNGQNNGLAIDVGCGNGVIDILLAEKTNFEIIGCDISDIMLERANENLKLKNPKFKIRFEKQNAYNLNYPDNYFDIVFGFGYYSPAAYQDGIKEIFRVLKPNGLLICDFINHWSLYKLIFLPKNIILKYAKIFEIKNIIKSFEKNQFRFIDKKYFNTYPPIFRKKISSKAYVLFENTIGKLLKRLLGRVVLISFQKINFMK
jgi:ubiquinone/menaquinone biosynthesis C-methylase UbiE